MSVFALVVGARWSALARAQGLHCCAQFCLRDSFCDDRVIARIEAVMPWAIVNDVELFERAWSKDRTAALHATQARRDQA